MTTDGPQGHGWSKVATPPVMDIPVGAETFVNHKKGLAAIRSHELGRWHLSVSHRDRIPTWGELGEARDALLPADVWLMIPHPPRRLWLNYDPRVLHLFEFRDSVLTDQFTFEGEAARAGGYGNPNDGEAP